MKWFLYLPIRLRCWHYYLDRVVEKSLLRANSKPAAFRHESQNRFQTNLPGFRNSKDNGSATKRLRDQKRFGATNVFQLIARGALEKVRRTYVCDVIYVSSKWWSHNTSVFANRLPTHRTDGYLTLGAHFNSNTPWDFRDAFSIVTNAFWTNEMNSTTTRVTCA